MRNVRTLPIDKFGRVYHGPRTFAEATFKIDEMLAFGTDQIGEPIPLVEILNDVVAEVERAGYTGVATRIRKQYIEMPEA